MSAPFIGYRPESPYDKIINNARYILVGSGQIIENGGGGGEN